MSITRRCGMCDEPVLKSNSGAPNRRCASCQRRYMEIGSSLDPNRARNRRIQWLLERRGDKSAEITAFLSRKVKTPKAPKGSRAAEIEAFLKANGGPRGFTPMTEVDKFAEMAAIMYQRKARGQLLHEQHKAQLLQQGLST